VIDLTETVKLRWIAEKVGFDKLSIKNGLMKCHFAAMSNKEYFNGPIFGKILEFVQKNPKTCNLKEVKDKLILNVEGLRSIKPAIEILKKLIHG
ncbi:MAG: hypothetical protein ACKVOU_10125, partial [Cytophagales bacterium]